MNAGVNIHEPKSSVDEETPLGFTMEGQLPGADSAHLPYVWSPGWNSNQSVFKFQQEVGGAMLGGDAGVRLLDASHRGAYPASSSSIPSEEGRVRFQIAAHRLDIRQR